MCIRHIPEITLAGWYEKNISHLFPVIFRNRYHIIISLFPESFLELNTVYMYVIKRS